MPLSTLRFRFCRPAAAVRAAYRRSSSQRAGSMGKRKPQVDSDDELSLEPEDLEVCANGSASVLLLISTSRPCDVQLMRLCSMPQLFEHIVKANKLRMSSHRLSKQQQGPGNWTRPCCLVIRGICCAAAVCLCCGPQEKPKKKRQSAPKKAFTEPFVDKLGWNVEPPSLIWRWVKEGCGWGCKGEPEGGGY